MKLVNYSTKLTKKQIFLVSIPVFFSNLAIPFVGIVDTALMGNLEETKYLAATSIATSVMTLVIWSFGFLRMGTVGVVSQAYGKGDYTELVKTLLRNAIIALIIALFIIILKPLINFSIKHIFTTSIETQKLVISYLNVRIFSVPAELMIYIFVGFYLGIQKTKISSLLILTLSFLNILFSSFFVLYFNLNIFGVALGTLLSSYITLIIFTIFSYNFIIKYFKIIPRFERLIVKSKILELLNINFDIFIRTLLLTFSFLWLTYQGLKLGEDYLAANSILMQFVLLAAFFLDAYAFSTEGIIGFTIGKRNKKSFLQVVKNSIQLSFITALIVSIFYIILFKEIIDIITEIEILKYLSYQYFIWIIIIPPIASFCYQLDGIFIGASQTKEMRNAMTISVVFYIFISIYFIKLFDNHGLWFSLMIFMILRALTLIFYFNKILRKF